MSTALQVISLEVSHLASNFPKDLIEQLASTVVKVDQSNWAYSKAVVLSAIAHPAFRAQANRLLDIWETKAPEIVSQCVSLALFTAAQVEEGHRQSQKVELVWTGPDSQVIPLRRTDQALLQLIQESKETLLIVSFAVYKAHSIFDAIAQATRRGVVVSICLETAEASEGKLAHDSLRALGSDVAQAAQIYVWPLEKRMQSSKGNHGSLHAKVAVADRKAMLVSSANLTEYAMTLNMEMGLLLRGGLLPSQVHDHFARLIEQEVLIRPSLPNGG